jgi:formylmethanofuran dehydrogenase subunit E
MRSFELLLRKSAGTRTHLCPRQILGVRIGLAGMDAFVFKDLSKGNNCRSFPKRTVVL